MIFVQICTKLSCICVGILFKINYGDKISLLNILLFAIIIFKKIFGGKWYFARKLHLLKEFPGSFYETELLKPGPYYVHRVQVRAPFHILILIISLVVLRAYLCKDTLHLFYRGPYFTCQPYRVEKVEQDRFAAEDRFHRARNLRTQTEWYSTFIPKKPESFPTRKWILECHRCLAMNFVYWQTQSAYYYSRIYYYFFALKKLSQIYAKKS